MRIEWSEDLVVKAAESDEDRLQLGVESSVLRAVAHPAVIRVTEASASESTGGISRLCLQRVRGTTLVGAVGQSERLVAGWGAAVATVVADLHDLGYVHGAIAAEHVLIDEHGRPILCGFGHARRVRDLTRDAARDAVEGDVRAVARLVLCLLPRSEGRAGPGRRSRDDLSRLASRWAEGRHGVRGGARALARALVERVPDAAVGPLSPVGGDGAGQEMGGAVGGDGADGAVGGAAAGQRRRGPTLGRGRPGKAEGRP